MPPTPIDIEKARAMIVGALGIGDLPSEEQRDLIERLGTALIERATYDVLKQLSPEQFEEIDTLMKGGREGEVQNLVAKYVPNAEQIVENSFKAGVEEYKKLVREAEEGQKAITP